MENIRKYKYNINKDFSIYVCGVAGKDDRDREKEKKEVEKKSDYENEKEKLLFIKIY